MGVSSIEFVRGYFDDKTPLQRLCTCFAIILLFKHLHIDSILILLLKYSSKVSDFILFSKHICIDSVLVLSLKNTHAKILYLFCRPNTHKHFNNYQNCILNSPFPQFVIGFKDCIANIAYYLTIFV